MSARSKWNDPFRRKADPKATIIRHRTRLLRMDGVVSVGLGFDESHRTVIVVGVSSPEAAAAEALPRELDSVPVEVRPVGELKASGTGSADSGQDEDG